jgi:DNA primase
MQTVDGRARMAELARPLLERIPAGIYRELLVDEVAQRVRLNPGRLTDAMAASDSARPRTADHTSAPPHRRVLSPSPTSGRGSVIRQAIRILVHHPKAALEAAPPGGLDGIDRPGITLLKELLADLQSNPCPNTATLLERWRGRPDFEPLAKLAGTEYPIDLEGATQELLGALEQLYPERGERRLDELLRKQAREGLTDAERLELQAVLTKGRPEPDAPGQRT